MEPKMYILSADDIRKGLATDIYFIRSREILEKKGLCNTLVRYEIHTYGLPRGYKWAVYTGLEEVLYMLKGTNVTLYSLPEGTLFRDLYPLAIVEGKICDIIELETAILGILRFYTSVSTKAARIKKAAGDKQVIFFGLRVQHPAIAPALDRAAYIGGCDGVSGAFNEKTIGVKPKGTMPHALIIVFRDPVAAWKAFDEVMPPDVPRIALVDTFYDERVESLMAAQTLSDKLWGVRLDTPRSRRGDIKLIAEEVKWTLKLYGYENVKIVISGGVDEEQIANLRDVADVFGVGTSIAFPPSIDISMDIVEIFDERENRWIPITKRGKLPGSKQLYRCIPIVEDYIDTPNKSILCKDGREAVPMLDKVLDRGMITIDIPKVDEIRKYVLDQLKYVEL
ncbi:MAG: nicotinate phosphoribosyltransferase [Desulfurococcaceae archaeon]|jgi:nicotinate phosphoribosyltransferase|nr:nicotinate phosphoribosyltransferase [Desulfurococcaceae archaeon]MCC6057361.1 nicotinate phosphoribosyltransferase [Desulfurococcaceae archaeon]